MCQPAQVGWAGQVLASTTVSFPSAGTHLEEWGPGVWLLLFLSLNAGQSSYTLFPRL